MEKEKKILTGKEALNFLETIFKKDKNGKSQLKLGKIHIIKGDTEDD